MGLEPSDPAVAHQFAGRPELAARPLLGPELEHDAAVVHGLTDGLGGTEAPADGLLAVHVFALPGRLKRDQGVPVIGGGDLDGVDVLAAHQFAEILDGRAVMVAVGLVHGLLGLEPLGFMHVTDGRNLDLAIGAEGPHVTRSLDSQTDASHHHAVGRRCRARLGQDR
jgi:hypothetical protein